MEVKMSNIRESQGDISINSSLQTNKSIQLKQKNNSLNELLSDIENLVELPEALIENSENETSKLDLSINTILAVDSIKEELCKVPLSPCEKQYFENSISPLLLTIDSLSRVSLDLSTSVSLLTTSPIVPRKKSKLKDTIHLIYDINDQCENIYNVLKKRVDILIGDD